MNNRQIAAVREVEAAMKKLEDSGLVLAGVDSGLVAFSRRQYYSLPKNLFNVLPGPAEVINELDYISIKCPFIDCGGT